VLTYPAVALFVIRARAVAAHFRLHKDNLRDIVDICRHLGGIPLAIELAAARTRSLSVYQIAARLRDRFDLLTAGASAALPRHQTLRATLDWSYGLLSEEEKANLRRLSVFAGGCTLEAAEAVCADDARAVTERTVATTIDSNRVLDLLTAVVDASLVVYEEEHDGTGRYRLLDTTRQYAREKLSGAGSEVEMRRRHRDYFLALAEDAHEWIQGPKEARYLDLLETENDNLRQALSFCREDLDGGEAGLRICNAMCWFWLVRNHRLEGTEHITALLSHSVSLEHSPTRAQAFLGAGALAYRLGNYGDAHSLYQQSLIIHRHLGDRRGVAHCVNNLGILVYNQGDLETARLHFDESMAIWTELGDKHGIAMSLNVIGAAADRGDYAGTKSLCGRSLAIRRTLGDQRGIASCLNNLGRAAADEGDYAYGRHLHEQSLAIRRELKDRPGIARSLNNLGIVAYYLGDYAAAHSSCAEGLAMWNELRDKRGIAESMKALAGTHACKRETVQAARLWAAAERIHAETGCPTPVAERDRYEREVAEACRVHGEAAFRAAWDEGRAMTMQQAVAYALSEASAPGSSFKQECGPGNRHTAQDCQAARLGRGLREGVSGGIVDVRSLAKGRGSESRSDSTYRVEAEYVGDAVE
jgi:tetratricopeptide (TPR) repeat protein